MDSINRLSAFYDWTLTLADKRVAKWPLIESPLPTIAIVVCYLAFVVYIGPKFMRKRKAMDFGLFLPAYNFALVALNYYNTTRRRIIVTYAPPLRSDSYDPNEMKVANGVWWYYFSKIIELCDTVLFTLRKRDRQITFLHVYHHSTMPILWWIGTKWIPGGQSFVGVILNSSVHVIMYSYYGLSAMGPRVQKYLWWKKYITMIQLVQFVLAIAHTVQSLYVDCPSPRWMHWALIGYAFSFIVLFTNFYIHAYWSKSYKAKSNGHTTVDGGKHG
uniref:Elongation of very long chain fatty acids protein n=1 Tax=Ciona savignyi TaxID=51511 RepID=H2YG77_CIOSA